MKDDIDDSLIKALTKGMGPHLGKRALISFYNLKGRLPNIPDYVEMETTLKQQTTDFLAISVVYTEVISPLESGKHCMEAAEQAGASHIRIGRDQLTADFQRQVKYCVRDFYSILSTFCIPDTILAFATLKDFVKDIIRIERFKSHETVD